MAARKNYPPMIDLLVKHGADVNAQAMCTRFYHRKLRYPLKDYAVHKGTPLLFAVETTTNGKTVKVLLGHGADPEIVTGKTPYTPLMWAAHRLKIDIVKMLLEAGALPNHSAHHGQDLEGASNLELIRSDSSNDQPFHAEKCKNMDKSLIPYLSDDERYVSSDSSDASEDGEDSE
nr:hypothetical protein BaRGS_006059 [Batillaria attramentaria]